MGRYVLLSLLFVTACGGSERDAPPTTTQAAQPTESAQAEVDEVDEVPSAEPDDAPSTESGSGAAVTSFHLQLHRASGAVFRDEVSVRDDGQLIWVAQVFGRSEATMHGVTLQLTDAEVQAVRAAIESADFFTLGAPEGPSSTNDAEQLVVRIRAGERENRVMVEEQVPERLSRVVAAVDALLTDARREQLAAAPEPQPEDFDPSLLVE